MHEFTVIVAITVLIFINRDFYVDLRRGNGTPIMPYKSVPRLSHTFSGTNCLR